MIVYYAIIPDNELIGIFTSRDRCQQVINELNQNEYIKSWNIEVQEAVLNKTEIKRKIK